MSPAPVVFSAVPTLFTASGELDPAANRALYKLVAGLVDGLFVAGTTGEFPALEDSERLTLFELALAEAGPGRVIAHIGAPDARHAGRLARAAAALGAERIAAITPYYLPARPDELTAYYRHIREAAPGPGLYAYIFPERTGLPVPPPLFAQVAEAAGLAGAKVSGSASADLAGYVAAAPSVAIFSGNDANPAAAMRAGGAGVISGRSSAYPEVYAALRNETRRNETRRDETRRDETRRDETRRDETRRHQPEAQERLDRIVALGASIGRVKHALSVRGLANPAARMTVDPPDLATAAAIAAEVTALLA